jgi:DNA-binding response OmpR family regulator
MGYHALIIEDDTSLADMLRRKLSRSGHKVTIAGDQRSAYALLDQEKFDFVLLDLRLPTDKHDLAPDIEVGFAILARIRDRFTCDALPVIVMTAYEETSQTAVRALKGMANDYITKPFEDVPVSLDDKLAGIGRCIEEARQIATGPASRPQRKHRICFKKGCVEIDEIEVPDSYSDLLRLIGRRTLMLSCEESGRNSLAIPGRKIAEALEVTEPSVRTLMRRFRNWVVSEFKQRGMGKIGKQDIIRNVRDWKGYAFNSDYVQIAPV